MTLSEQDKWVIEQYEQDEEMMVLIFAQWCENQQVNATELYKRAYPHQMENKALLAAIEQTVPKTESEEITTGVILHILQLFGNDDLAFVVQEVADEKKAD